MSTPSLTDSLSMLAAELCSILALYSAALTEPCGPCIAEISECNRRVASLAADTHARLFAVFCPPLPRAPSVALCERLHAAVGAVFGAGMMLPADHTPNVRLGGATQALCRMGELLRAEVDALPHLVKGRGITPPDTYAYHAELNRVRAAHALFMSHGDHPASDRAVCQGIGAVTLALSDAYAALLTLVGEAL